MTGLAPFRWYESGGWIVLSGRADPLGETRARALSRAPADGGIAYVSSSEALADALMEDMADLGAPAGYLVDLAADANEIYERIAAAGMLVIAAADDVDCLLGLLRQTAVHAIKAALNQGALALFEGDALALAGAHYQTRAGKYEAGLGLVHNVSLRHERAADANITRLPPAVPGSSALHIAVQAGAALALGPGGSLETWGESDIKIQLGQGLLAALPAEHQERQDKLICQ